MGPEEHPGPSTGVSPPLPCGMAQPFTPAPASLWPQPSTPGSFTPALRSRSGRVRPATARLVHLPDSSWFLFFPHPSVIILYSRRLRHLTHTGPARFARDVCRRPASRSHPSLPDTPHVPTPQPFQDRLHSGQPRVPDRHAPHHHGLGA